MTTKKAFLWHLGLSSFVVGNVLAVVFLLWYPQPYFQIVGAMDVLKVLIFVDLILGPLLTLILYRPGKRGLKFDMGMVFAMQIAALVYGVSVIYEERPYYSVFVVDRFEVMPRKDVDESQIDNDAFRNKPWATPVYAVAKLPDDWRERHKVMEETLFEGKPDIHQRPEYWRAYADGVDVVGTAAKPVTELIARQPDMADRIQRVIDAHSDTRLVYVPVTARTRALTLLLDSETLYPVTAIDIDPWRKSKESAAKDAEQVAANL